MPRPTISSLFHTRKRFLRSAHLERDFRDPAALEGYIVTREVRENLTRLRTGLNPASGQRAWRITGDYGSGKSSFALLLAHAFAGKDSSLPPQIRRSLDLTAPARAGIRLLPILITGSRDRLATAVFQALAHTLTERIGSPKRSRILPDVQALRADSEPVKDDLVLRFIREATSEVIAKDRADGLLIIIDELGKFLEFSAQHPERQDVFFLQQLAELATRSGKELIFTVGLLHQGFHSYADQLSQSAQREWEKVAGRFEEILFDQPLEQITHLIAAALDVTEADLPRGWASKAGRLMRQTIDAHWFGPAAPVTSLCSAAKAIYPLHPTVVPILARLFSRFGQNERSLFSFLLSTEPFGLRTFSDQPATADSLYRIHHLYDYAAINFGHRLSVESYRNHWNHIDSLVHSFPSANEIEVSVLKTVGLLNLLNLPEFAPTEDALVHAIADAELRDSDAVRAAIHRLSKQKHVLYYRGKAAGYCLWSHVSVNLDLAYDDARRALPTVRKVGSVLKDKLDTRPIVARRHYIQTGNLRHFEVTYCSVLEIERIASAELRNADGRIVIPLCETAEEVHLIEQFATTFIDHSQVIIGITEPLAPLSGLIQEVERWTWIQKNTPELREDKYAAEEVGRQLQARKVALEKRVQYYVGLKQTSESSLSVRWFHRGRQQLQVRTASQFLAFLSNICDELYNKAPRIHNELINRRLLSSAAAGARMRLLERMLTQASEDFLGMDQNKKPPEMSMYLSVLRQSNAHRQVGDAWVIGTPAGKNDYCQLSPALDRLCQILDSHADSRVSVERLFDELRRPPFGIRDGVLPVLLVILLIEYQQELAMYENGTFLSRLGPEEVLRATKRPSTFELQMCRLKGVRLNVFRDLLDVLRIMDSGESKLLDVVRPLCVFVAGLPQYSRTTKLLPESTLRVRSTILEAKEPSALLFRELPMALGLEPFKAIVANFQDRADDVRARQFAASLKAALNDLRQALPRLHDRMRSAIVQAFDYPDKFDVTFRALLSERAENLLLGLRDLDLKAFCLRLADRILPEGDWLESVGSYLASTPPSRWKDSDEITFHERLQATVEKFRRVESVAFGSSTNQPGGSLFRIALTARDGQERDRVVRIEKTEEKRGKDLEKRIASLLKGNSRVSVYALSRLMWKLMEKN
jgi:hypothetical protein